MLEIKDIRVGQTHLGYTIKSFYTKGNNRMVKTVHECGAERSYSIYSLRKGDLTDCKQCGGIKSEFPPGFRTTDGWTVLNNGYWGGRSLYIEALHNCGHTRKFTGFQLRNNQQKCKVCEAGLSFRKPLRTLAINNKMATYKSSAARRNLEFDLSKDQFELLIFGDCHYCGRVPQSEFKPPRNKSQKWRDEQVFVNGIDRIDNSIGYLVNNCSSCCWTCNKIKSAMSIQEWSKMVDLWFINKGAW